MENIIFISTLLILFLPLLSFVLQLTIAKNFGDKSDFLPLSIMGTVLLLSIYIFYNVVINGGGHFHPINISFPWIATSALSISLGIYVDAITSIMLCVVSLISFLVHLYSTEYMKGDKRYLRYFAFLGLFTFSMNGIILADSLFMMYLFWELVGLSSFLLIGFWFEKDSAANASKKAFLTNRVGDIGMFIGMMILFFQTGTFHIQGIVDSVASGSFSSDFNLLTCAGLLVFMGAVGKSAQFPLHIWLPDAMEGPTPVSALIHAATMVAAGVYMTIRIFPFLTLDALSIIAIIGSITAVMAAIIAVTRNDIKAVLAYSTISQLGYMIMAIGVGAYVAAFFHLVTHAMFKACLFLCSGSVIHAMHHSLHELDDHETNPQDMNNMGGLMKKMPITFYSMLIATLAISGIPLFSGFLSKDAILAGALSYYHLYHGWTIIVPLAGFGAALITAFYMFRLIFLTFFGNPKNEKIYAHIHESPRAMTIPLILLSILSFAFVFTFNVNPFESQGWFDHSLGHIEHVAGLPMDKYEEGMHHAHYPAMFMSLFVAFLGIFMSSLFYFFKTFSIERITYYMRKIYLFNLSRDKFYIDSIYDNILYKPFLWLCNIASKLDWNLYDQIFIDSIGKRTLDLSDYSVKADYDWLDQKLVDGTYRLVRYLNGKLKYTQSGIIQNYLMAGVLGIVLIALLFQQI